MKKLIFASTLLGIVGATDAESLFDVYAPVIGVDYKWTRATLISDWNNLFAQSFPGVSLYTSMKFMENLGVELGYDMTARKGKDRGFSAEDMIGGSSVPAGVGSPYGFHTSLRFAGAHADLLAFLPIDSRLELFVSLGISKVKPTIFVQSLTGSNTTFDEAVTSIRGNHHKVKRFGVGANWSLTDSVGFRAKLLWETLPSIVLKDNVSAGVTPLPLLKPWLKGYSLALGFFMKY